MNVFGVLKQCVKLRVFSTTHIPQTFIFSYIGDNRNSIALGIP